MTQTAKWTFLLFIYFFFYYLCQVSNLWVHWSPRFDCLYPFLDSATQSWYEKEGIDIIYSTRIHKITSKDIYKQRTEDNTINITRYYYYFLFFYFFLPTKKITRVHSRSYSKEQDKKKPTLSASSTNTSPTFGMKIVCINLLERKVECSSHFEQWRCTS